MTPVIKQRVLQEIELIPEDKLADLYHFLHYFRLGLEKARVPKGEQTLAFAGCWQDMPDELFAEFRAEISERRSQAFVRRRSGESFVLFAELEVKDWSEGIV